MTIFERFLSVFRRNEAVYSHPELTEEELRRLRDRMETAKDSFQEDTETLTSCDYELIGQFVQAYCIADFYARRLLEDIRYLNDVTAQSAGKLNDLDVLTHLRRAGSDLPMDEEHRGDLE